MDTAGPSVSLPRSAPGEPGWLSRAVELEAHNIASFIIMILSSFPFCLSPLARAPIGEEIWLLCFTGKKHFTGMVMISFTGVLTKANADPIFMPFMQIAETIKLSTMSPKQRGAWTGPGPGGQAGPGGQGMPTAAEMRSRVAGTMAGMMAGSEQAYQEADKMSGGRINFRDFGQPRSRAELLRDHEKGVQEQRRCMQGEGFTFTVATTSMMDVKPQRRSDAQEAMAKYRPVRISGLVVNTTHVGCILRGRLVSSAPIVMNSAMVLLEDEQGDVVRVSRWRTCALAGYIPP